MSNTDTEHRTCVCPAEPEVHCHACTKHERDERLRVAREFVQWCRDTGNALPDLLALDDEVTRLDAVVTAVREVHQLRYLSGDAYLTCEGCGYIADDQDDPCPTVRALDGGAR